LHDQNESAAMKVLLFGGTFDPVHNGHVAMLRAAQLQLQPDETRVIPVGNPWQKGRLPFASAKHRMAMLKLAFPDVIVDPRELDRSGPTYTFDTLAELHKEREREDFFWLIGTDSFHHLHTWHRAIELITLVTFAVVRRANEVLTPPSFPMGSLRYVEVVTSPPPISSTAVRAAVQAAQAGEKANAIRDFVPNAVCDYIAENKLYQTSTHHS
jgi:nicotinate-nucleotide adenylyltransferase